MISAHHKEDSILEDLPIDMVDDFVIAEDLHLLHLGIMKKMLFIWKDGGTDLEYKWSADDISKLNKMLTTINQDMPNDIHRSVRNLHCLNFWKGSEYRTFLLYIGIFVLKPFLRQQEYEHFTKLYCAVTLCSTEKYFNRNRVKMAHLARTLFDEYIEEFISLYGIAYISSNVHNLTHVVDDILRFGIFTKISAYPFENCLGGLKLRLRNCNCPLEQISRRIIELDLDYREPVDFSDERNNEPIFQYSFEIEGEFVYKQIFFGTNLFLSSRNFGDKWFLTHSGEVVEFHYSLKRNQNYLLYGSRIKNLNNFFTQPFSSSKIYVFSGSDEKCDSEYFKIENVMAKMICIRNHNEFIFMPLLHTLK